MTLFAITWTCSAIIFYILQRDSTDSQCHDLHARNNNKAKQDTIRACKENSHECIRLKFKGKENMAKKNSTSIDSAATSYLRDNNERLQCCHLIRRNKNKRAYLWQYCFQPAFYQTYSSSRPLLSRVTSRNQTLIRWKPRISWYFACFRRRGKKGSRRLLSFRRRGMFYNDIDKFPPLSDTVVKQHSLYCALIHLIILSFGPQTLPSACLLCRRARIICFWRSKPHTDDVLGKKSRVLWLDLQNTTPPCLNSVFLSIYRKLR